MHLSLSARGYSLTAVCGSRFDPALMPALPKLAFHHEPCVARRAIEAVQRARLISYMERAILPREAFRSLRANRDARDEHCVHLILHRRNCLYGAIRCQFHHLYRDDHPEAAPPLFVESLKRSLMPDEVTATVLNAMATMGSGSASFMEIGGWLVNPDLRKCTALALALPAAVWAFVGRFPEFAGVSMLRASNGAARTLLNLGALPLRHDERDLVFTDPFYRGQVQMLALHSRRYHPRIEPLVQDCLNMLTAQGVLVQQPL